MAERVPGRADVERDLEHTRVRIIGARMVWAGWAQDHAQQAANLNDRQGDGDARWRALIPIDEALQRAETELEIALRLLAGIAPEEA